jgi:hypothetical protein
MGGYVSYGRFRLTNLISYELKPPSFVLIKGYLLGNFVIPFIYMSIDSQLGGGICLLSLHNNYEFLGGITQKNHFLTFTCAHRQARPVQVCKLENIFTWLQ